MNKDHPLYNAFLEWKEQGRTEEQIYGVQNFLTGTGMKYNHKFKLEEVCTDYTDREKAILKEGYELAEGIWKWKMKEMLEDLPLEFTDYKNGIVKNGIDYVSVENIVEWIKTKMDK